VWASAPRAQRLCGEILSLGATAPTIAPVKAEPKPRLTPMYRVLIHNDSVTSMEFVVEALMRFFGKSGAEAVDIMMEAHQSGVALVAVLPLEQAELRVEQTHALARTRKYPLTLTYEPA
jgi:ATP-dependent Clp protease adaptor protein ClpS